MTKKDYKYWTKFRANKSNKISKEEFKTIAEMHARLKEHAYYLPCTCNPKGIQRFIDDLNTLYNEHRNNA